MNRLTRWIAVRRYRIALHIHEFRVPIRWGDPRETDALRERLLISHIDFVRVLTAINAAEIHGDKRR